ncbi:MAG: metal-dependent hydrolase [Planctomycetes bacterium]|nr:metal-dependent hydrolase [Planctomycetota bacterium]
MSSPVGHILGTTIVYAASSKAMSLPKLSKGCYLGLALLALLPDIDAALLSHTPHRGVTHGLLAMVAISFLFYLLLRSAEAADAPRSRFVACSVLCAAAHPIMDTLGCPARPVEWFSPFWYSGLSIDPYWTILPQPYFYIVHGNSFYLPLSAIMDNIPQLIFEVMILSGVLVFLTLPRSKVHSRFVRYVAIVVACLSWIVWRLYFPTVWMR